jgi:hypothetical protein
MGNRGSKAQKAKASVKKDQKIGELNPDTTVAPVDTKPRRKFNIIVWGATGFTGALVCKHLAEQYHKV